MISYRATMLAREGWLPVAIGLTMAILLQADAGWKAASGVWLLLAGIMYLFRDPPRKVPSSPLGIVAPVDGVIIAIREGAGPYLDRDTIAVKIRAHSTGVFSVRSPTEGKVVEQWFGPPLNETELTSAQDRRQRQFAQWIKTDENDDIVFVLKPKIKMGKFRCYLQSGERIGQGQRCAFVLFGANTEVMLPVQSQLNVKEGNVVRAGETIIATLVR